MTIPVEGTWASLSPVEKRERLLRTAGELFASQGFDASMPAIAAAAGAGVGSLYRQFEHKDDLIAALAIERLREVETEIAAALEQPEAWVAFVELVHRLVEWKGSDPVTTKAVAASSGHADVEEMRARIWVAFQQLLDRARDEGRLRDDATTVDVRLLFAASTAAEEIEPGASRRLADLMLDGLAAQRTPSRTR
jgi:AcrR family transcriptional regulator